MNHPSLVKPKRHEEPPTRPLMEKVELQEIAKTALLEEVENQMLQIVHEESTVEQLQHTLDNIQSILLEIRDNKNEYNTLKLEVLQKLKNKLANAP